MQNVAVYYRVSTDKQDLDSQKQTIDSWLDGLSEDKKPRKVYTFEDRGISGKTLNRPGMKQMLEFADKGKIDTIIVYKLDRFSRHATTAINQILNLDQKGVAFISVTQPVLNLGHENPFRRTMLAAFAEIAEIERETIVARVRAGLEAAKKRGVKLGPPTKIKDEDIEKMHELRRAGASYKDISTRLGFSVGAIHKAIKTSTNDNLQ